MSGGTPFNVIIDDVRQCELEEEKDTVSFEETSIEWNGLNFLRKIAACRKHRINYTIQEELPLNIYGIINKEEQNSKMAGVPIAFSEVLNVSIKCAERIFVCCE